MDPIQPSPTPAGSSPSSQTMLPPNFSALAVSPTGSNFIPRREFVKNERATSSFALISFSGANFVRLSRFPDQILNALRRMLHQRNLVRGFREVFLHGLSEFTLDGKPWSNSKSFESEKLIVDILAVLFYYGYTFLSTIDYGREPDDRLCLAFSRPTAPPGSTSPLALNLTSSTLLPLQGPIQMPFALSFPSANVVRVISPPLRSTPAILQAVRSAWPRGVASEKKLGENCYEFKLKGYKWFQEDTYATDSLTLILSLLNALDVHGFALLTSFCLGARSRVKDLWIFTGCQSPDSPRASESSAYVPEISSDSKLDLKRAISPLASSPFLVDSGTLQGHLRSATVPEPSRPSNAFCISNNTHARAMTDSPPGFSSSSQTHGFLRKPSPKTQPPSAMLSESFQQGLTVLPPHDEDPPDMTGVGAGARLSFKEYELPDIIYSTPTTFPDPETRRRSISTEEGGVIRRINRPMSLPSMCSSNNDIHAHQRRPSSVSSRPKTPPLLSSRRLPSQGTVTRVPQPKVLTPGSELGTNCDISADLTPPLLSPNAFRDSAFSSSTKHSFEIPIAWTGVGSGRGLGSERRSSYPFIAATPEDDTVVTASTMAMQVGPAMDAEGAPNAKTETLAQDARPIYKQRISSGPELPGGWSGSLSEVEDEHEATTSQNVVFDGQDDGNPITVVERASPERRDVDARVAAPEFASGAAHLRKSEAGLVGMITPATENSGKPLVAKQGPAGSGDGWVFVNLEGTSTGAVEGARNSISRPSSPSGASTTAAETVKPTKSADSKEVRTKPEATRSSTQASAKSSMAKATAVRVDAVTVSASPPSGLKTLFSFSRSRKNTSVQPSGVVKRKSIEAEERAEERDAAKKKLFKKRAAEAVGGNNRVSVD